MRGGAKARGVGIGATIAQIQSAFPKAIIDHSTEQLFGITLVKIPKTGGGRIQFAVDVDTRQDDPHRGPAPRVLRVGR